MYIYTNQARRRDCTAARLSRLSVEHRYYFVRCGTTCYTSLLLPLMFGNTFDRYMLVSFVLIESETSEYFLKIKNPRAFHTLLFQLCWSVIERHIKTNGWALKFHPDGSVKFERIHI